MKNVRIAVTAATLLVSLATGAAAMQAAPAQPKAAAPAGPKVQSPQEAKALQAIVAAMRNPATTPQAMDAQITQFNTQFPTSEYATTVNDIAVQFFHAHQDYNRTLQYGENALKKDPNSLFILLQLGSDIPSNVKDTDLDKDQRLKEAEDYNQRALKIAQNLSDTFNGRPLNPQQKQGIQNMVTGSVHSNMGQIDLDRKQYSNAVKEYQAALPLDAPPVAAVDYYHLALAQEGLKDFAGANASLDKAIANDAQNPNVGELAKVEKQKIARQTSQK